MTNPTLTQSLNDDEISADGINWHMVLAYELAKRGVCADENDIDPFCSLMGDIDEFFGGDTVAAAQAVRTFMLAFEFAHGSWWIRLN
jgi:hypothetical protein